MNKCQVCGKSVRGSLLCEECEKIELTNKRPRGYILSGLLGIILVGAVYYAYQAFKEREADINYSIFTDAYYGIIAAGRGFIASPYMLVPVVVIFIILAFIIGVKISK